LIEEHIGRVYTLDEKYPSGYGWGYSDMAKFEVKVKNGFSNYE
jgi:hypothetical protein